MEGIVYIENLLHKSHALYDVLKNSVIWDERMSARKTASFGRAYNYAQMSYPYQEFTAELKEIIAIIKNELNFAPNNCLINYYLDGKSKMGFHADQTDILADGTGVAIISLGETRILRFKNIQNREIIKDFPLASGSMIYMRNEVQKDWLHAIPPSNTYRGRMSLTFRKLIF